MWGKLPPRARWIAAVYVAGFAEGTCSHAYSVWAGGIHAFSLDPVPIQVVFHAMLVFDALAVMFVIRASPVGPPLAAAAILTDASANWWTQAGGVIRHPLDYLVPFGLLPITLFAIFVLVTVMPLRRAIATQRSAASSTSEHLV